jgi:hypothetical protein
MPGLWNDFAHHYNAAQDTTANKYMDRSLLKAKQEAAKQMEASMRALLGTLCGIVIQSANLISDNHADRYTLNSLFHHFVTNQSLFHRSTNDLLSLCYYFAIAL